MTGSPEFFYTGSFDGARQAFLRAAAACGAPVSEYRASTSSPSTAVASLGPSSASHVLLHLSGTHGIEGYVGSAIQIATLSQSLPLPNDTRILFFHGINAWGMKHLRKVNSGNVDLNRNFLLAPAAFKGAPEGYRQLDHFINPQDLRFPDLFLPKALLLIARYGMPALKDAVAGGQYDYPEGLYFGGHSPAAETERFIATAREQCRAAKRIGCIDVHSGLGSWGEDSLLISGSLSVADRDLLKRMLGERVQISESDTSVAYHTSGGLVEALPALIPHATILPLVQEFGTYSALRVLKVMREENCSYHQARRRGDSPESPHPSRQKLLETFCPSDVRWKVRILQRGQQLIRDMLEVLIANRA